MAGSRGSVRIGPISLFMLVIVICISVMAVLAVSTAKATYTLTERQAEAVENVYENETAAQTLLSLVDKQLATGVTEADRLWGLSNLAERVSTATTQAEVWVEGDYLVAQFVTDGSKYLDIRVEICEDASYRIESWKATTQWPESETESTGLWMGGGADEETVAF